MLPTRCDNLLNARKKHGNRADKLAAYILQGDPLADEVVAFFNRLPPGHGVKMLDHGLEEGIDKIPRAPASLRDFFAQIEDVPLWLDWERLDLGSRTYMRCGFLSGILLGCSLPLAYRSAAGSKPLAFSRQLFERSIRRLSETNRFFLETCFKPGGLKRHNPGWKITIKVRLMHAQMRRLLRQGKVKPWQGQHWGVPINQMDMAATCLLFSVSQLRYLRQVGFHFSTAESESVMHLWRYCGHLLGIVPELLCTTEGEGRKLEELLFDVYDGPDQDSIRLTRTLFVTAMPTMLAVVLPWLVPGSKAPGSGRYPRLAHLGQGLLDFLGLRIPPPVFREKVARFCYGLSHRLLGGKIAAELDYPQTRWRFGAPALLRALVRPLELCRRLIPGGTDLASRWGHHQMQRLMRIALFAKQPLFPPLSDSEEETITR